MKTQLNAAKIIPIILSLPSWSSWNQPCYREKVGYDWVFIRWRSTNRSHWSMYHTLSILGISLSWQDYKGFKTSPLLSLHTWNEEYEQNVLNLSGMFRSIFLAKNYSKINGPEWNKVPHTRFWRSCSIFLNSAVRMMNWNKNTLDRNCPHRLFFFYPERVWWALELSPWAK